MTDNEPMSLKLLLKLSEMAPNVYLKLIYANYYNNFCGYYKVHN